MVAQILRASFGDNSLLALVEHNNTVGERIDTVQFMGDNHKGHFEAFAKAKDESIELGGCYRINPAEGSSRKSTAGSSAIARAIAAFSAYHRLPPAEDDLQKPSIPPILSFSRNHLPCSKGNRVNSSMGKVTFSLKVIEPKRAPL